MEDHVAEITNGVGRIQEVRLRLVENGPEIWRVLGLANSFATQSSP